MLDPNRSGPVWNQTLKIFRVYVRVRVRFSPMVDTVLSTSFSDKILLKSIIQSRNMWYQVLIIYLTTLNTTRRLLVTFQAAWARGPLCDRVTLTALGSSHARGKNNTYRVQVGVSYCSLGLQVQTGKKAAQAVGKDHRSKDCGLVSD